MQFHQRSKLWFRGERSMNTAPWIDKDRSDDYPDDSVRASYRTIVRACLCEGLSPADADDLAQDLWEWLIRTGVPMAVIATPWLKGAVHNYILRFRRRNYCHQVREGKSLATTPEPQSPSSVPLLEENELLDRVASILPKIERNLLALLRRGHSVAEAARILGIPRGSRAYYQGRLISYARREIRRRNILPMEKRASGQGLISP